MKKVTKQIMIILFAGLLGVTFYAGTVLSEEKWALGTSGAGSGPYVWGATISKTVNKYQDAIRVSSQATAGFRENLILVDERKVHVAMAGEATLREAYEGLGKYKNRPFRQLRVMFCFIVTPYHLVTREAAGIKTIYDLKGKKFNIGLPAQATRITNEQFLKAANIKVSDIKVFEMPTGQTFRALQDGVIDGTGNLYSAGHGQLLELSQNTRIRLLEIPKDVFERFNQIRRGSFVYVTIPENSYKGQNYPVKTAGDKTTLYARDDLPEEQVYQFTKAFWDNLDEVRKVRSFKTLKIDYTLSTLKALPVHPGAERYFKEIGLLK